MWINAENIINKFSLHVGFTTRPDMMRAIQIIKDEPGINIVRCKDCKWLRYCETEDLDLYLDCDKPDGGGIPRSEEWFCADGERKEGEKR